MRLIATTMLCGSLLLQSNYAHALFSVNEATIDQQFVQIALAEEDLRYMMQMLETLEMGSALSTIFQQMFGIQSTIEDVMVYEPPQDLVTRHEIMNPMDHKRLTEERNQYLTEIDAEFASIKSDIVLNPDQLATLTMAAEGISSPQSDIQATQAQFIADQASLEQARRDMAYKIVDSKHEDIKNQIIAAQISSREAALKCIREKKSTNDC